MAEDALPGLSLHGGHWSTGNTLAKVVIVQLKCKATQSIQLQVTDDPFCYALM